MFNKITSKILIFRQKCHTFWQHLWYFIRRVTRFMKLHRKQILYYMCHMFWQNRQYFIRHVTLFVEMFIFHALTPITLTHVSWPTPQPQICRIHSWFLCKTQAIMIACFQVQLGQLSNIKVTFHAKSQIYLISMYYQCAKGILNLFFHAIAILSCPPTAVNISTLWPFKCFQKIIHYL